MSSIREVSVLYPDAMVIPRSTSILVLGFFVYVDIVIIVDRGCDGQSRQEECEDRPQSHFVVPFRG